MAAAFVPPQAGGVRRNRAGLAAGLRAEAIWPNLRSTAGAAAIALGLSGETHFECAKQNICACEQPNDQKVFAQVTEAKFNRVRRRC